LNELINILMWPYCALVSSRARRKSTQGIPCPTSDAHYRVEQRFQGFVDVYLTRLVALVTMALLLGFLIFWAFHSSNYEVEGNLLLLIAALLLTGILAGIAYVILAIRSLRLQSISFDGVSLSSSHALVPGGSFSLELSSSKPGLVLQVAPTLTWYLPIVGNSPLPLLRIRCAFATLVDGLSNSERRYIISGRVPSRAPITGVPSIPVYALLRVRFGFANFDFYLPVVERALANGNNHAMAS
jgi:hypothetical protein